MSGQVERGKRSLATLFYPLFFDGASRMTAALPPIKIHPDGVVRAGEFELQPSARTWRRRRCWWRAMHNGKPVSGWTFSPSLALTEAVRKLAVKAP